MEDSALWESIEIFIMVLWGLLLILLGFNIYHYLYVQGKYRFVPMLQIYVGMSFISLLLFSYYIDRELNENTRDMTTWIFISANVRFSSSVATLGFLGMIFELIFKLQMLQQSLT